MKIARYASIILFFGVAAFPSLRAQDKRSPETAAMPSPTVARQFHYQGCLTKPDGTPQPDGAYQMKFEIVDQAITPGVVLFSESASIIAKKGLFEHAIGSVDTIANKLNPHIFQRRVALRLTVNNETLLPLIPISAVPVAMVALYADSLKQPLPPGPEGPVGPQGPQGPAGAAGLNGANGKNGLDCWDLNGNGINDPAEDINADAKWDALDCKGPRGPAGPPGGGGKDTVSITRTDSLIVLTLSEHYGPEYFIYEDPVTGHRDTTRIHGGQMWIGDGKGGVSVSFDQEKSVHNIPEYYIYTDPVTGKKDTTRIFGSEILMSDGKGGTAVSFDPQKSVHNVPEFYIYTNPLTGKKDTTILNGGDIGTTGIAVRDANGNLKIGLTSTGSYHEVPEYYVHVDPLTGKRDTTIINGGTVTGRSVGVVDGNGNPMVTFDGAKSIHKVPEFYISVNPATGKPDTSIVTGSGIFSRQIVARDSMGRTVGEFNERGIGVYPPGSTNWAGGITNDGRGDFRTLQVRDSTGAVTTIHDKRGYSFHYKPETFYGGVTIPLENGNTMRLDPVEGLTIKNPSGGFIGHLNPTGSFFFVGTKSNIIPTASYGTRQMYAVEAPDVRYTDYGSSRLSGGEATVRLDPMFLETVTIDDVHPMIVMLTPSGDCRGLYVARKGGDLFVVRELAGGTSNTAFDWQVVVKRRGHESTRMEPYQRAATRGEMEAQGRMPLPMHDEIPMPAAATPEPPFVPDAVSPERERTKIQFPARRAVPEPVRSSRGNSRQETPRSQNRSPR